MKRTILSSVAALIVGCLAGYWPQRQARVDAERKRDRLAAELAAARGGSWAASWR